MQPEQFQPERFQQSLLETAAQWNMLPDNGRFGIAVSGGGDSVALTRVLHALAAEHNWHLCLLHCNHKLRGPESDGDEHFVRQLAAQLGLFCKIVALPLAGGGNREAEARELRYRWLGQVKQECALDRIVVGHTRSDQAETLLFRILRGSGGAGLAGIRPVLNSGIVRPLLGISRESVRAYLHAIGQEWREDSSNRDLSLARNRIRLQLLPELIRDWNPRLEQTLAHTAQWALAEEEYWDDIVAALARETLTIGRGPAVTCRADDIGRLPLAAARRLIREAIRIVLNGLTPAADFAHVEVIRRLLDDRQGSGRLQIPGVDIMRSFEWVRFAPPGTYGGERRFSAPAPVPGEIFLFPDTTLSLQFESADTRYNEHVNRIDADSIPRQLLLRTWQPGDQYEPAGRGALVKLKTLFQNARIPLWERRPWPVLVTPSSEPSGEAIVWTRQFGVADQFASRAGTRRLVAVSERKNTSASAKLESEPEVRRL